MGQIAAIYCRVSTNDQDCKRQEMDLIRFSERAGYEIAGIWKETASGSKDKRQKRQQILALAQSRKIDIILVTELTRWGRSTLELFHSLNDLNSWGVSLIAQTGLQFDLSTPQGKLIATLMSGFVNQRAKLTRVLGKTALKSFHPRLCKIRYFVGEPWSVNHGYNCRSQKTTSCQWREY